MDWLARAAAEVPRRPALVTPEERLEFGELDARVGRAAAALSRAGVCPGDRVALWGGNDLLTVTALWAVPRLGAVAVPLHGRLTPAEAAAQAARASVAALLAGPGAPELGVPTIPLGELDREGGEAWSVGPDPDRVHSIVFTSGTSGTPRGVLLTWGNLEASAAASATRLGNGPGDAWLAALPLYHVGGLSILWRSARERGSVVLEPGFDPGRVAGLLHSGAVSLASLVPTMLHRLLEADRGPYRGLRAVLVGGGAAPVRLVRRALEAGLPILPTYGMTETASQVVTMPPGETARHPGSAGTPLPGVELRIAGGEVGEIEVRGPMVSPGYLGEPPRAPDAWHGTGDLGRMGARGHLTVLGRLDQAVITGGEKVHPGEVEQALLAHPAVAEAAVYGEDDPEWGRAVAAAVVADAPVEDHELDAFLRDRLAAYKIPRRWRFVEELPRAALGKVDRSGLQEEGGRSWISD